MNSSSPIDQRWAERGCGKHGDDEDARLEDRAAELMRSVPPPIELSPATMARIRRGLREPKRRVSAPRWKLALSLAAIPSAVFAALSVEHWTSPRVEPPRDVQVATRPVALNANQRSRAPRAVEPVLSPPPPAELPVAPQSTASAAVDEAPPRHTPVIATVSHSAPAKVSEASAPARGSSDDEPAPSTPLATPTPADKTDDVDSAGRSAPVLRDSARSIAPPAIARTNLSVETQLLGNALRQLHQNHDGAGTLAVLDEYRARFPDGTLKPEAQLARLDALLLLHRRAEALVVLDHMTLSDQARARELRLLRGELRAEGNHCRDAIPDFDAVSSDVQDGLEERALFGRASCHTRLDEPSAAQADLNHYLARFPAGRFAPAARRALAQ